MSELMVNIIYYMFYFSSLFANFRTYAFTTGLLFSAQKSAEVKQIEADRQWDNATPPRGWTEIKTWLWKVKVCIRYLQ